MAILKSLCAVAWADGRVADDEKEVIEALLQAFDANDNEAQMIRDYVAEPKTLDDIPLTEMDSDDRRVLLQHAVFLTFIDGNQDEKEKALLQALSDRLRIPAEERIAIMNVAEDRAKRFLNLLLPLPAEGPDERRPGPAAQTLPCLRARESISLRRAVGLKGLV